MYFIAVTHKKNTIDNLGPFDDFAAAKGFVNYYINAVSAHHSVTPIVTTSDIDFFDVEVGDWKFMSINPALLAD
jgi:hypothetical protein